ncbi:MAG: hypothetical protein ABJG29_00305, partial [Marinomonas sp.]
FRPHHLVGQRGFARIGLSDQGDESGACGHCDFLFNRVMPLGHLQAKSQRRLARQFGLMA